MAFLSRKKEEDVLKSEQVLLDATLMQNLQDRFCDANNLYLRCLDKNRTEVTKTYGSKEELEYLGSVIDMDRHIGLLERLLNSRIESVIEEDCGADGIRMCGVAVKVSGEVSAIWIVTGVMEDAGCDVPDYIMRTTPERYYKSIEFLETLSKQMFAVKLEELLAQEAFLKSRESEIQMETELKRNEAMTAIVRMLESEEGFDKIVHDILKEACEYLGISAAVLFRENIDGTTVNMISEYCSAGRESRMEASQNISKEELPFFNGKPYMISADSMMPEAFRRMFEVQKMKAGLFLPIDVSGKTGMYVCFCEDEKERIWDGGEIKFVNDVRRIIQTILVKRIAKNSLASSYASLEAILENVGCGIYVMDTQENTILYTNQHFRKAFGEDVRSAGIEECLRQGAQSEDSLYFREVYSKEENRWFDLHSTRINWVDGRKVLLCTIYDVTDKKLYQQKIERQANNDFLTGLYNRMRCEQDLERYIRQTKEFGGEGALLYIDLDDFKHINDGLGHQYGDILLKALSNSLRRIKGIEDSCYRMGGDEFIIIVKPEQYDRLEQIIEEVQAIFNKPWFLHSADYYCTMSMGVVRFPKDANTVTDLIKKADISLYEAKKGGKNRVEYYGGDGEDTASRRLDMEKNMRDATANSCEEFEVYYQPVIDISGEKERCSGVEALVRWNSGKMGMVGPGEFIPLAEYLGLINPIGDFVLRKACEKCKYWNDMGHPEYRINVNLSVVQLLQNDIVERIRTVLEETKMRPENLTLEVTESLAINDIGRMKKVLSKIKELGALIALDDFGTGYSSLSHIRELPIDIIKIDRCFVIDLGKDDYAETFVRMVAELADTIGVRMCVEGVEDDGQLQILKDMKKVQYIQGYYYDKPLTEEAFEKKYL